MPLRDGGFVFYVDVWAFLNRPAVGLFELRNISQLVRGRTMCASLRSVHAFISAANNLQGMILASSSGTGIALILGNLSLSYQ